MHRVDACVFPHKPIHMSSHQTKPPRIQSCGVCKSVFAQYHTMALEASYQRAGVRFLTHDVRTEFDERSDVAHLYNTSRTVPTFLFFVDGAVVCWCMGVCMCFVCVCVVCKCFINIYSCLFVAPPLTLYTHTSARCVAWPCPTPGRGYQRMQSTCWLREI